MSENKNLKEQVEEMRQTLKKMNGDKSKKKKKKFKLPRKARVKKKAMKQGYVTVCVIKDNKSINFEKVPLDGGTYKLEDENLTYHLADAEDIYFYNGNPVIFQPKRKENPTNPIKMIEGEDETYAHEQIMDRMTGDAVKKRSNKGGDMGKWIVIGVIALIAIYLITQYI